MCKVPCCESAVRLVEHDQQRRAPRGDMRRRIVALLQEYPEGLSPVQTRQLLSVGKDLGSTMKVMMRDGLLRRVETGRYVAGA
jgi:hypothetical protein